MKFAEKAFNIFADATDAYHVTDCVDTPCPNPYEAGTFEHVLFEKNWIDVVQWHLEDLIRDPQIDPAEALVLKRRIDASNQVRTDMVEQIDTRFREQYADVTPLPEATINTETPAWAFDRLSILAVKIYHMKAETERADAAPDHVARCQGKLDILLEQRGDLIAAIDMLLDDIEAGRKYMKVYRQMKMYNDPSTNPVLYAKK